jgi:trans-aconitate methyltransferase
MKTRRMDRQSHWDRAFASQSPTDVSWYQPQLKTSLELIAACDVPVDRPVIDVGGGASTLVDSLLKRGFSRISVLDIAKTALDRSRQRLGSREPDVEWLHADITSFTPSRQWSLWHDRAVFHFLTDASDRQAYCRALHSGLAPGGHVVMATFGPGGPKRCSGLRVMRYASDELIHELGSDFALRESRLEQHTTPRGSHQEFLYVRLQLAG